MSSRLSVDDLKELTWQYYAEHGRHDLPWRQADHGVFDPYRVLVSEIMLQQTQVSRVIEKYREFLVAFPDVQALASAELARVLTAWSGLGYNRRAKFLWQAAQKIVHEHQGIFPNTQEALIGLPGVGKNTAGAIMAYAYNQPVIYIETNIRTVFIYHCFSHEQEVGDALLLPLITEALDHEHPRDWYYALMDYGSYLKKTVGNASRQSKSYTKQSAFHGSRRQIRGQIITQLTIGPRTGAELATVIGDDRLPSVLDDLVVEGLIRQSDQTYQL